ncbi:NAD(P)-dependent oxidoreductase [Alteribacter populi]|uniref:NAD(P)-dependent oxidoreductase n=1 Tax=Alteribacter populi TaxID=2011011 RepID=UPI000BBA872E|nr:NAD(P)H-binding protein [Alteribacter populi]
MNILLFGTTGRVGSHILKLVDNSPHLFTAFVRSPEKLPSPLPSNVRIVRGDAKKKEDILEAIKGQDGVISCLSTDKTNLLSSFTPHLVTAMEKEMVKRIVSVGTAGILQARTEPEVYRFQSSESNRKATSAAEDHLQAFLTLKESSLDWTLICPTYLPNGEETGNIRYETDYLPEGGKRVTTGDTARFAFEQFFKEDFIQQRVGLTE